MVPTVGQWIADTPGTISLGQGVVWYGPPAAVGAAIVDALRSGNQLARYSPVQGLPELLQAIHDKLVRENQIHCGDGRRIVVTPGSNLGFVNAVLAIGDPGDEIVLVGPYYFNHEMAITMANCRPLIAATDADHQLDLEALRQAIGPRTRAIVTVSPNNPTGAVYSAASLTAVNRLCAAQGIYHIHDEAYEQFVYGGLDHFSPASLSASQPHTISLFSLSKAYGMAGYRAGFMVIPAGLEASVKKVQDTALVCPPVISQVAAAAALGVGAGWCAERVAGLQSVRDTVLESLDRLGGRCRVPRPEGAFYVLAQLDTDQDDVQLVRRLIRDFGIAVLPGSTFGVSGGCSIRIAYGALDQRTVRQGMKRLLSGLDKLVR